MRIVYGADIHINHWLPFIKNQTKWENHTRTLVQQLCRQSPGDVLVLGGDFSEWNVQTIWILEEASKYYGRVYWTYGNHDLYLISKNDKKRYMDSWGRIQEIIHKTTHLSHVIPLIQRTDTYKGITFAGDALFYAPSERDIPFFNDVSSDSAYISIKDTFTPYNAVKHLHTNALAWYNTLEHSTIDVFVSHVPPMHFKESGYAPNTCYQTDVPFLAAPHWICGHVHMNETIHKYGTTFHFNCFGYPPKGRTLYSSPDLNKTIQFKHFDMP